MFPLPLFLRFRGNTLDTNKIQEWIKQNPLIVVALVGALFLFGGKKGQSTKQDTAPKPETTATQTFDQAETWETLARWVETQDVPDTNHIVDMAKRMRNSGALEGVSRLDSLVSKNEAINDSNRARIVALIRGK